MFSYSWRVMIILRRSVYCVGFDGRFLAFSFHCHQLFWKDLSRKQTFRWKRLLAELCFSVLCSSCFTHSTKAPWFLFHFHKADVTSRAFSSHFVSQFLLVSFPGLFTNVDLGSRVKRLMFAGGVFLYALLYYQGEGHWILKNPETFHSWSLTHERWCSLIFPWIVCCLRDHYVAHSSRSVTTFPHVSLFTKGDDSAKTVPVQCCIWLTCFGPFRSIATSSFVRNYPGRKHFLEAAVGRVVFLSAVFVVFHSPYQSTLIPVPPSIRPMWLESLSPHTFFLCSKCWNLRRPIHP